MNKIYVMYRPPSNPSKRFNEHLLYMYPNSAWNIRPNVEAVEVPEAILGFGSYPIRLHTVQTINREYRHSYVRTYHGESRSSLRSSTYFAGIYAYNNVVETKRGISKNIDVLISPASIERESSYIIL